MAVRTCSATAAASALPAQPRQAGRRCGQGRATTAFGWLLIQYGIATVKYVIGLLLIMLGSLFVAMGWMISAVEWIWC